MFNPLLEKINSGEIALGAWINSTDPLIAEIFATFGCEWVFIDTEHEPIGRKDLLALLLACKGTNCTPVVRVPANKPEDIKWVLDLGAGGVIIPQIANAEEVTSVVQHTRYQPMGERGAGAMRASEFATNSTYYDDANNHTVVIIQAEDIRFVEDLDRILDTDGYDAIFVGPMDLAQTMGHLGHPEHPEVQATVEKIIRRASAAGKCVAVGVGGPEDLLVRAEQGARLFILGSDYRFVRDGIRQKLAEANSALASRNPQPNCGGDGAIINASKG